MPHIISNQRLSNFVKIGEGSFGTVYRAHLQRKGNAALIVAVKLLTRKSRNDVFKESSRMEDLEHPNIVELIAITATSSNYGDIPWIVMEYMDYGDLLSYIRNYPGGSMTATGMVKFAYGIANGMAYLHHEAIQKHGDLAARNCLVGPNWSIKIGDFGRYDPGNEDQYYNGENEDEFNQPFPVGWMPPENLPAADYYEQPRFTRKGDVWAFGVVLFEIWTRARLPYEGLVDLEVVDAIRDGENPMVYRAVSARHYILNLMSACWNKEPNFRPNFKNIKRQIEENDPNLVRN